MLALVPDASSARAARSQAGAARWPESGASEGAVWGLCQGSGTTPYQVSVELAGPAFRCTCPSRKFPCKHALGLLLRWSADDVADSEPPGWVGAWLADRAARAERAAKRAETAAVRAAAVRENVGGDGSAEAESADARRRRERRADRVAGGAAELGEWLLDRVRGGLADLVRDGGAALRVEAARMVDAQSPGLAAGLTRAADHVGRVDWPGAVLAELASLHLAVSAHARLAELPAPLADTVRTQLGYTVEASTVLRDGERVADTWLVLGRVDEVDDQLTSRRVWLRGTRTGRAALVLSFAPPGRPLDGSLVPGTAVDARLAYHPGALPLRAVVVESTGERPAPRPDGDRVADALAACAGAVAADPWRMSWPVLLAAVTPVRHGDGWALAEADGTALPVSPRTEVWPLVAVSAGSPLAVAGEWSPSGVRPLACWDGDRAVTW